MMKKAISTNIIFQKITLSVKHKKGSGDVSDLASCLAVGVAEGAEVSLSQDHFGGLVQLFKIEPAVEMIDIRVFKGRAPSGVQNPVAIVFCPGISAGMKIRSSRLDVGHSDRCRQTGIQSLPKTGQVEASRGVEMADLPQCMSSGIGSSRTTDMDRLLNDAFDRPGQLSLNGAEVGLDLPSVIVGSVILDFQTNVPSGQTPRSRLPERVRVYGRVEWHLECHRLSG